MTGGVFCEWGFGISLWLTARNGRSLVLTFGEKGGWSLAVCYYCIVSIVSGGGGGGAGVEFHNKGADVTQVGLYTQRLAGRNGRKTRLLRTLAVRINHTQKEIELLLLESITHKKK